MSAHDYHIKSIDYFDIKHGRNGWDDEGGRVIGFIDYGPNPGMSVNNAFYNFITETVHYGIGGGSFRPFTASIDVAAHELTHGITWGSSGLIYENQSGAMNESLSDIFGYLVEAMWHEDADWLMGEDLYYSGGAIRSLSNPPAYGDPDNVNHPYFVPYTNNPSMFTNDNGGVHSNSGIPNKVMYLVIKGDEHYGIIVNPFDDDINLSRDIASSIWFNWNRYYLEAEDDFAIGREKMLQVAIDLWPSNYSYYQTIANAWASVGVGEPIVAGDINGDLIVNIQDIVIMIGAVIENIALTEEQILSGDLNYDGIVDVLDIVLADYGTGYRLEAHEGGR